MRVWWICSRQLRPCAHKGLPWCRQRYCPTAQKMLYHLSNIKYLKYKAADLSPVHTASDTERHDHINFQWRAGDKSDSDRWRRNVGISSDAGQVTKS